MAIVAMAGYALRRLYRLHTEVPGGLRAAPVLLALACPADAPLSDRSAGGAGTVRTIARDTAMPRETARRLLGALTAAGWSCRPGPKGYEVSDAARRWCSSAVGGPREFLWFAEQVEGALTAHGQRANALLAAFPWAAALATQYAELPYPPYAEDCTDSLQRLRRLDAARCEALGALVEGYMRRHVRRLWAVFEADLSLPLIIGEIAHRNVSALAHQSDPTRTLVRLTAPAARGASDRGYLPINAHSLAVSLRIPNSTVTRRLAQLTRRGWISMAEDGTLSVVSDAIRTHTADLNAESCADFLATHEHARTLLATA